MRNKKFYLIQIVILVFLLLVLIGCEEPTPTQPPEDPIKFDNATPPKQTPTGETRSFYMGFTTWVPGPSVRDERDMYTFIEKHGDLIVYHLDGGVPWVEAGRGDEFSSSVQKAWKSWRDNKPKDHMVFLMLSPLDGSRFGLAEYWGESPSLELPADWKNYYFNDEIVREAYLFYVKKAIDYFNPDYFALGTEINTLLPQDKSKWNMLKEFHKYIYTEVKKDYPNLPTFSTIALTELRGDYKEVDAEEQKQELKALMPYMDILALSAYPFGWNYYPTGKLDPLPKDFFDVALEFNKPIAISETGAPSQNFHALGINYRFDQEYQKEFIEFTLNYANKNDFVFIVNWANLDFHKMLEILPPGQVRELGAIWAYTGIMKDINTPKSVTLVWDGYLKKPIKTK